MMAAWLVFSAAFAGFGLLSLAMQRHRPALSGVASPLDGPRGRAALRTFGAAALVASLVLALRDNSQLGAINWSGDAMAAMLLVASLHAFAERWAASIIVLGTAVFIGSVLAGL